MFDVYPQSGRTNSGWKIPGGLRKRGAIRSLNASKSPQNTTVI